MTDNIIPFPNAEPMPAPDCKWRDPVSGEWWYLFNVEYIDHEDQPAAFEIWARSLEDAHKDLLRLRSTVCITGQVMDIIDFD